LLQVALSYEKLFHHSLLILALKKHLPIYIFLKAQYLDVICINRYFGWYSDTGHTELITYQMINEVKAWHDKHEKPILVTEYGKL